MSARIAKILNIEPMIGYDAIEIATVYDWKVAVTKNTFKVGDLVIYYSIGSILPNADETAFLKGQRIKTRKFRKYISQGLVGPLDWLRRRSAAAGLQISEDDDVTEIMGVTKWIPEEERALYDPKLRHEWPSHVPKTDEDRAQNCLRGLKKYRTHNIVITKKYDGTSTTFMWDGRFIVCSRNSELRRPAATAKISGPEKLYFNMADKYGMEEKLTKLGRNIAIQGETVGPTINANRMELRDIDFFVFNIYDIDNGRYMCWDQVMQICNDLGLKTVDVVYRGPVLDSHLNITSLLELADAQSYASGAACEGIVLKTDNCSDERFSCKVISNKYILKHDL
jgi:RNA ligase (TIGR02306 family)